MRNYIRNIVVTACSLLVIQFTGCEYSRVASYETTDKKIKIVVLDPTECDVARSLQLKISAFGEAYDLIEFQQLSCQTKFQPSKFEIFEHADGKWVFFLRSDTTQANNEVLTKSVCVVFDRENKKLFSEKASFPQIALKVLKKEDERKSGKSKTEALDTENEGKKDKTKVPGTDIETDTVKLDYKSPE